MELPLGPSLILLAVAGWLWLDAYQPLRWIYKRSDGNRLYFGAILHGSWIGVLLYACILLIDTGYVFYQAWQAPTFTWPEFQPAKLNLTRARVYLVTFLCIPFVYLLLVVANKNFYRNADRVVDTIREVYGKTDELALLMLESAERGQPMIFTLTNGKVYVGYATEIPDPGADKQTLTFLPVMSGMRTAEGKIRYTTRYNQDINSPESGGPARDKLMLTVAISHIVSFHLFNFDAYTDENDDFKDDLGGREDSNEQPHSSDQVPSEHTSASSSNPNGQESSGE